jgi:hypothetical protein
MTRGFGTATLMFALLAVFALPASPQDRPKGPTQKTYSGEEFLKALTEGQLKEAAKPIVVYGAVRASDKTMEVLIAGGKWTALPMELVEKIEHLSTSPIREHEHPFARIYLREPLSGNAAATLLTDLIRQWGDRPISGPSSPQVFKLIGWPAKINKFVDTGTPGDSPGDLYVVTGKYFFETDPNMQMPPDSQIIATADGRCVLIDPDTVVMGESKIKRWDCSVTTKLSDEDFIMSVGTYTQLEGSSAAWAIVGGTGKYRRARGEYKVTFGPVEGPDHITVTLFSD